MYMAHNYTDARNNKNKHKCFKLHGAVINIVNFHNSGRKIL